MNIYSILKTIVFGVGCVFLAAAIFDFPIPVDQIRPEGYSRIGFMLIAFAVIPNFFKQYMGVGIILLGLAILISVFDNIWISIKIAIGIFLINLGASLVMGSEKWRQVQKKLSSAKDKIQVGKM